MRLRPSPDRRRDPQWYHWLGAYALVGCLWIAGIALLPFTLIGVLAVWVRDRLAKIVP